MPWENVHLEDGLVHDMSDAPGTWAGYTACFKSFHWKDDDWQDGNSRGEATNHIVTCLVCIGAGANYEPPNEQENPWP